MFAMSKINKARTLGLVTILVGMGIMIIGMVGIVYDWGTIGKVLAYSSMIIGVLFVIGSMVLYFWAGMISTNAVIVDCPRCAKATKVVGMNDYCMYCHTALSFDPKFKKDNEEATR